MISMNESGFMLFPSNGVQICISREKERYRMLNSVCIPDSVSVQIYAGSNRVSIINEVVQSEPGLIFPGQLNLGGDEPFIANVSSDQLVALISLCRKIRQHETPYSTPRKRYSRRTPLQA
ncbi:MAG: hypothetical protein UY48_C0008G0021 [Candidatus Gottesmanbacteria bacterium GW2011_GWB1_49_7]|uniref:Uncharacterized protein n=1 Tax=Candidatus Gottesmanbacteria bacterium GW2011_GWB1_49_7 TaxID=1618448 RepID=A0A0G1W271_9BACT|nr:MAG: hypothetical protein UY48_C0008G0021 [Candidatus Gottesmanbacteria bacterium GW2011_GWB1_49_7]